MYVTMLDMKGIKRVERIGRDTNGLASPEALTRFECLRHRSFRQVLHHQRGGEGQVWIGLCFANTNNSAVGDPVEKLRLLVRDRVLQAERTERLLHHLAPKDVVPDNAHLSAAALGKGH